VETDLKTCPNCGGTFKVPAGVSAVRCPYCSYTVIFQEVNFNGIPVYFLPKRLGEERIIEIYREELNKQVGVPESLSRAIREARLYYIPMAVFEVEAKGQIRYGRFSGDVCYADSVAVSANPRFSWMDGLHIPAVGRVPLDPNRIKNAKIVEIKDARDCSLAENRAKRIAYRKLKEMAMRRGCTPSDTEVKTSLKSLVYYPVYHLRYSNMHAVLDGIEGEVIFGMYNPRADVRAYAAGGCGFIIAAGIAGVLLTHVIWPVVVGVAGAIPISRLMVKRNVSFGLKANASMSSVANSFQDT